MDKRILVINPGSTSTKLALFQGEQKLFDAAVRHSKEDLSPFSWVMEQADFRQTAIEKELSAHNVDLTTLDAVCARGGQLPYCAAGTYLVDQDMVDFMYTVRDAAHASNLGCAIAYEIAQKAGVKAYIYDPVTVDELIDLVRITGLKDVRRVGQAHNLNMRAAAMKVCREKGIDYYGSNIVVAHLGGGITMSLHSNGCIVDIVSDDEGPFSPERAGLIPDYLMVRKIEKDKLDYNGAMKLLQRQGGLTSFFGTSDTRVVEKMAEDGDREAQLVYEAMALGVARGMARLAVLVRGKVDYFVLTGGIAYSEVFCEMVKGYAGFLGEFVIVPGENEMQALADGCLRVLNGEETAHIYG